MEIMEYITERIFMYLYPHKKYKASTGYVKKFKP